MSLLNDVILKKYITVRSRSAILGPPSLIDVEIFD